jgi:hypothetical protein
VRRIREDADAWVVDPVMDEGGYDGWFFGGVDNEADARLIAAAPSLLAALEDLLSYADPNERATDVARAVIAKAKGDA